MTVETDLDRAQYATNATTGPWTVPFYFLASSELAFTYTDAFGVDTPLVLDVDYTVVGAGDEDGGTITTTQAYAAGGKLTVIRDLNFVQETKYVDGDSFPADAHERALDRLTMMTQQLREVLDRALRFSASDTNPPQLPTAAVRANSILGFDSAGNIVPTIPASGSAADVLIQLSSSDPFKGAALVGNKRTAVAGIALALSSWLEGTVISANQVGIVPGNTSAANTALLQAMATVSPGCRIYFPGYAGTYLFGDLSLATGTHYWFGDGIEGTKFHYTGTGKFLNGEVAVDAFLPRSPIYIEGIGFSGGTKSTQIGLSLKNRHDYEIRNCSFDHFSTILRLNNAYEGLIQNVTGTNCDIGWDIDGDVNNVKFFRSTVTDFATYAAWARPGMFGNIALSFDTCGLQFGAGVCFRNESDDHIVLTNSYLGDGCTGNVFEIVSGQVSMEGGLVLFGQQASFTNRLVEFIGANPVTDERSLSLHKVKFGGGTFCGPDGEKMVKGTGKLYIEDCGIATVPAWSGGAVVIAGDPIGYRPGLNALQSPHGRTFTGAKTGTATFTAVPNLTTGSLLLTCTAGGGAGDAVYAYSSLLAGKLQTFGALGETIVYRSNADWGVQLASLAGTFNTGPTAVVGSTALKNTGGAISTMLVQGQTALAAAYTVEEIFRVNCAVGDYIEFFKVAVYDERQYGAGGTLYAGKNLVFPI